MSQAKPIKAKTAKPIYRYAGNRETKEVHRLKNIQHRCNFGEIIRPVMFTKSSEWKPMGYDACAHCNRHWKSRDNK